MQGNDFAQAVQWCQKIYFDQINYIKKWFSDYPDLKAGDRADMVLWDYVPATPLLQDNFFGHLIFGLTESRANTVIKNGSILMEIIELLNLNTFA